MLTSDITFLIIIGILTLSFTIFTFIWKGNWIFPIVAALGWFLFGFFCFDRSDEVLFYYQREIGYLFVGLGIATLFAPFYTNSKDADIERNAPSDIDFYMEARRKHRERIDQMKSVRRPKDY